MSGPERFILHIDMDAFYAAVEQRDRPELRGKPILVGGSAQGRGVVSTASYEARPFGCRSAMPMAQAIRLCPQAIVIPPRMERYVEVSRQVFEILEQFTPLVEPLSIDEAFLDVSGALGLFGPAPQIARELKRRVHDTTQLTASVGVAPNKFIAKLASDLRKPDGLVVVTPDQIQEFLDPLPISRLWGVGKVTLPRFEQLGIHTFGDARRLPESQLQDSFGEAGTHFYYLVRGIDDRTVVPDREAKSISHEITFPEDVDDVAYLRAILVDQTDHVARRLRQNGLLARTVVLKVRTPDFTTITRRTTLESATDVTEQIWQAVAQLFENCARQRHAPVRLIGMGVSQLAPHAGQQLALFGDPSQSRAHQLDQTVDTIVERFGSKAIGRGSSPRDVNE